MDRYCRSSQRRVGIGTHNSVSLLSIPKISSETGEAKGRKV